MHSLRKYRGIGLTSRHVTCFL